MNFIPFYASFGHIKITSALETMKNAKTDYRFTLIILWKASVILYCINVHFWPRTKHKNTNFVPFWLSFRLQSVNTPQKSNSLINLFSENGIGVVFYGESEKKYEKI